MTIGLGLVRAYVETSGSDGFDFERVGFLKTCYITNAGSIATKLNGCGQGVLTYGNCWKDHKVEIFLNGIKIDSANGMQV